jgi:predicted AAA+ superfamily ATPase
MIQRAELQLIISRIKEPRKFIQSLSGARQVGKTTLVLQLIENVDIANIYETADGISAVDSTLMRAIRQRLQAI